MTQAIMIGQQCHYCSRWKNPREVAEMPGGAKICLDCEQRHQEALHFLSTRVFTGECSECHKTAEQLRSSDGGMACHYEDGRYRLMCIACDRAYVRKRRDLYGETEFGQGLKL